MSSHLCLLVHGSVVGFGVPMLQHCLSALTQAEAVLQKHHPPLMISPSTMRVLIASYSTASARKQSWL